MRLRAYVLPSFGDRVGKNWCDGRVMQCRFEILRIQAYANLGLKYRRVLAMVAGMFARVDGEMHG